MILTVVSNHETPKTSDAFGCRAAPRPAGLPTRQRARRFTSPIVKTCAIRGSNPPSALPSSFALLASLACGLPSEFSGGPQMGSEFPHATVATGREHRGGRSRYTKFIGAKPTLSRGASSLHESLPPAVPRAPPRDSGVFNAKVAKERLEPGGAAGSRLILQKGNKFENRESKNPQHDRPKHKEGQPEGALGARNSFSSFTAVSSGLLLDSQNISHFRRSVHSARSAKGIFIHRRLFSF